MTPYRPRAIYVCGGNLDALEPRSECLDPIHDWPLPSSYVDACEMADSRLAQGWRNAKCPQCGVYGWAPGRFRGVAAESKRVEL